MRRLSRYPCALKISTRRHCRTTPQYCIKAASSQRRYSAPIFIAYCAFTFHTSSYRTEDGVAIAVQLQLVSAIFHSTYACTKALSCACCSDLHALLQCRSAPQRLLIDSTMLLLFRTTHSQPVPNQKKRLKARVMWTKSVPRTFIQDRCI